MPGSHLHLRITKVISALIPTAKNYCADTSTAEESQYCLKPARQYDNASLRITGGYDTLTGEPFTGQLSLRLQDVNNNHIISPLSSLTSGLTASQSSALLTKLGLSTTDLNSDYTAPAARLMAHC